MRFWLRELITMWPVRLAAWLVRLAGWLLVGSAIVFTVGLGGESSNPAKGFAALLVGVAVVVVGTLPRWAAHLVASDRLPRALGESVKRGSGLR